MMKLILLSGVALAVLSSAAFAADLAMPAKAPMAAPAPDVSGWDGAYIGVHGGYGPGTAHALGGDESYFDDFGFAGGFVGGQVGYNFTLTNGIVLGLEGDANWADESGDNSNDTTGSDHYVDTVNWTAAVTGHLGYAWDNFMVYGLGGAAWAGNTLGSTETPDPSDPIAFTEQHNHSGYTVGLGAAMKVTDNLSAFAEYRYSNYGSVSYLDAPQGVSLTDNSVRVGLNFHM